MAKFANLTFTSQGTQMLVQAQNTHTLTFTCGKLGSGSITDSDDITKFTDLKSPKMKLPIVSVDDSKVNFTLFRTDDGNLDVKKEITLDGSKQFTIPSKVLSAGSYTLKVSWKENKKPYQLDYDVQWK